MKRIYLAGPMSGLPDSNYPAFHREAARLRALGYHVENPAENPEPPGGKWEDYMRMSIAQLLTCDTLALLNGWENSPGALTEHRLAFTLRMEIVRAAKLCRPCEEAVA
jgi:hypothetical protein